MIMTIQMSFRTDEMTHFAFSTLSHLEDPTNQRLGKVVGSQTRQKMHRPIFRFPWCSLNLCGHQKKV